MCLYMLCLYTFWTASSLQFHILHDAQITALSESASLQEHQDKRALDELQASLRRVQADLLAVQRSLNTTEGAAKAAGSSKEVRPEVRCGSVPKCPLEHVNIWGYQAIRGSVWGDF